MSSKHSSHKHDGDEHARGERGARPRAELQSRATAAVWSRAEMGRERRMEVEQRWAELQSKAAAAHAGTLWVAVGEGKIWVGFLSTVPDSKYRMGFMSASGLLEIVSAA